MSSDPPSALTLVKLARMELHEHAQQCRRFMSASEWVEIARESEAGKLVGPKELRAILNIVWAGD